MIPDLAPFEEFFGDTKFSLTADPDGWHRWVLVGPSGAVQFVLMPSYGFGGRHGLVGADVGYHSPVRIYSGDEPRPCDVLPEGECYYDGSGMQADDWLPMIVAQMC